MTRIEIPGGVYGEALPDGQYAVTKVEGVTSSSGWLGAAEIIESGEDGPVTLSAIPLYVRVTSVGGFKIAGQSSRGGGTLVWNGSWTRDPRTAHGTSGAIFDHNGQLHIIEPAPDQTSQGYRYATDDGRLVLGDETYSNAQLQLWEFTTLGDLTLGQGAEGGAIFVLPTGERRQLEPGDCRFIRFSRFGNRCAIAISKFTENKVVLLWFDRSEVAELPLSQLPSVPPPEDPPVNLPSFEPRHTELLRQFAARFHPPGNDDDNRLWTRNVAEQFAFSFPTEGWGHKSAGEGRPPSTDAISRQSDGIFVGFDLLLAGEQLILDPEPIDLQGQVFIPVEPINHLEALEDDNDVPVDNFPDNELILVLREILDNQRQLKRNFDALKSDVDDLIFGVQDSNTALVDVVNRLDAIDAQLQRGFEGSNRFLGRFDLRPRT